MDAVVASFGRREQVDRALEGLRRVGLGEREVLLLGPEAPAASEVEQALVEAGVPEAQVAYYRSRVEAGETLVAVLADGQRERARRALVEAGGEDVLTEGAELARGPDRGRQDGGGARPAPVDLTTRWDDVADRYRMLFGQRYGASDATWEAYAAAYRLAWEMANAPERRGQTWNEARAAVRRAWEARGGALPWERVDGAMGDVWEDVADEARTGREGGTARNTAGPALDPLNGEVPPLERSPELDRLAGRTEDPSHRPSEGTHQIGKP